MSVGNTGGGPYYGLKQRAAGNAILVAPEGIDAGFGTMGGRDIATVRALLARCSRASCASTTSTFFDGV